MNASRIYSEAVGRVPTNPSENTEESTVETPQERELRFLNFNLQQTSRELAGIISARIDVLDNNTSSLSQKEGNEYNINRNLMERHTLQKVLMLFKKGTYE